MKLIKNPLTTSRRTKVAAAEDPSRPLLDHLTELRSRLLRCVAAVALLSVLGWFLSPSIIHQISRTVGPMVFLAPTEAFLVRLKLAVVLGFFLGAPVVITHAWRFIGVALTIPERRVVLGALPFSYLLFVFGAALAWFVIVPAGLIFLLGFAAPGLRPTLSVEACVSFALWTSAGLGLLFQLPVVIAALASWGIVRSETLRRHRRHALVVIVIVAAVVTPGPDVFSQILLAAPTYALYEISIGLARALEPFRENHGGTT